jgi:K+-transporting ATPase KdpF subunit
MKSMNLMPGFILLQVPEANTVTTNDVINLAGYIIGAVFAVLILGYLVYSLIKPEKF